MTNELAVFNYQGGDVRIVEGEDGNLWWVAKDVCEILGIADPRTITDRLDEDERGKTTVVDKAGKLQEMYMISESGLYAAVVRSNKPEAKAFQRWVRKDVLPSIRKTGGYSSVIPKSLPEALRLCASEIEKRQEVEKRLVLAAPKIDFYDTVADSPDTIPMGSMAKMLNMYPPPGSRYDQKKPIGRNTLLAILRNEKILMQRGENKNIPYQSYMDAGLFRVEEHEYYVEKYGEYRVNMQTLITGKGQTFIYKRLIALGCIPCKKGREIVHAAGMSLQ